MGLAGSNRKGGVILSAGSGGFFFPSTNFTLRITSGSRAKQFSFLQPFFALSINLKTIVSRAGDCRNRTSPAPIRSGWSSGGGANAPQGSRTTLKHLSIHHSVHPSGAGHASSAKLGQRLPEDKAPSRSPTPIRSPGRAPCSPTTTLATIAPIRDSPR
jgi:hypothetical protein